MVGAGAVAFATFARERDWRLIVLPLAVVATVAAQLAIVEYQDYMHWLVPFLIAGAAVAVCATLVRRLAGVAIAVLVCVLLVAPGVYARTTWLARVEGTFPAAGPHQATGTGEYGSSERSMQIYRNLMRYVSRHHPGSSWAVLTVAAPTAAPMMLLGLTSRGHRRLQRHRSRARWTGPGTPGGTRAGALRGAWRGLRLAWRQPRDQGGVARLSAGALQGLARPQTLAL